MTRKPIKGMASAIARASHGSGNESRSRQSSGPLELRTAKILVITVNYVKRTEKSARDKLVDRVELRKNSRGHCQSKFSFGGSLAYHSLMTSPFRYFNSSPEIIRLAVMMYVKYPLSLRNVEDLLSERGIDISHETVRFWWNRFGPMFAAEIRKKRVAHMRGCSQWRWHLDEVFVKINGKLRYLWRAVDHEGEVLETVVTAQRDKAAALRCVSAEVGPLLD